MERFGGRFFLSMSGNRDGGVTLAGVFSKTFRTSPTVERDPRIVLGKLRLNSDSQESNIYIVGRGITSSTNKIDYQNSKQPTAISYSAVGYKI